MKAVDTVKSYLDKVAKKMMKFANVTLQIIKLETWVWVKFNLRQFKALRGLHQNLVRKYEGPFRIIAKVGKISYKFKLPPYLKVYSVFHAVSSSHTMKTRMILAEVNQVGHQSPLLPHMI